MLTPPAILTLRSDIQVVGGLAAWTWGGLCGIDMVWIRADSRKGGWGSKILQAALT